VTSRPSQNPCKGKYDSDDQGNSHHSLLERNARFIPSHIHLPAPFPIRPGILSGQKIIKNLPESPPALIYFIGKLEISFILSEPGEESGDLRVHLLFFKSTIF
jgi:hypothetical protein